MAKYFSYFPTTVYKPIDEGNEYDFVTNIMTRFKMENSIKENSATFYRYDVQDGDTPETVAHKYYGSVEKHWIVLLFNDIIDPQFDWPIPYDAFNNYVDKKYSTAQYANNSTYGAGLAYAKNAANIKERVKIVERQISGSSVNLYDVKKSVDIIQLDANTYANVVASTITKTLPNGMSVKQTTSKQQKTYYDFEYWENEGKRNIILLQPIYVETIMAEFEDKVSPA